MAHKSALEINLKAMCLKGSFEVMGHEVNSEEEVSINRRIVEIMWSMATRYVPRQYGEIGELGIRLAKMMAYFPILEGSDSTIDFNIRAITDFPGDEFRNIIEIFELLEHLKLLKRDENGKMVRGIWRGKIHFHSKILMEVIKRSNKSEKLEETALKDCLKFCKFNGEYYQMILLRAVKYPELMKTHHQPMKFLKHCREIEESEIVPIGHKELLDEILPLYKIQYGEQGEFTMTTKASIMNIMLMDPTQDLSSKWKKWIKEFSPELEEFVKISEIQYLRVLSNNCPFEICRVKYNWGLIFAPFHRTFSIIQKIASVVNVESINSELELTQFYNDGHRAPEILRVFYNL